MSQYKTEPITHLIEDHDEIDAMLLRLQVLHAQSKPCQIIPFRPRPRGQAGTPAGSNRAHIIIYSDAKVAKFEEMLEVAEKHVPDEIKIHQLLDEQDRADSRREYARKCAEIERLLDLLAAPQCDGSIGGRFWAREAEANTRGEAGRFIADHEKKVFEAIKAEENAD